MGSEFQNWNGSSEPKVSRVSSRPMSYFCKPLLAGALMKVIEISEDQFNSYPEGFLDGMGRLVVEFGRAEYLVKLVFKQLHGLSFSKGLALAEGHRQFSKLCEETKKAADEKLTDVEQRSKLVDVLDEMRELSLERNDMIHAMWYAIDDKSMQRSRVELDKKTGRLDWSK